MIPYVMTQSFNLAMDHSKSRCPGGMPIDHSRSRDRNAAKRDSCSNGWQGASFSHCYIAVTASFSSR